MVFVADCLGLVGGDYRLTRGALGFPIEDGETDALVDGLVQAVVALASLFALFGRLVARARIG